VTSSSRRATFHYLLAVALLLGMAVALQTARSRGTLQLIKKALPLCKSLDDLDRSSVRPFEVAGALRVAAETIDDLGTSEYVYWRLQPNRQPVPWKSAQLFVTYYTGVQDQVPHVPEECMTQGAFSPDADQTLEMDMSQLGRKIAVRRLSFYPPQQTGDKVCVYYTICVNGDYCPGRESARLRMGDPRESHLYYSKVELSFEGLSDKDQAAGDQQAAYILDRVLTELVKSHWPKAGSERGNVPGGGPG
jgi:hypothetical protein